MKQVLHIFAKDARRLWVEILLSLVIAAVFTWLYPNEWLARGAQVYVGHGGLSTPQGLAALVIVLKLLLPVSWWILIARVVQAETLVGDRQAWITRPYEWGKLLAAKVLFVVVFIYLPLFVSQSAVLVKGGFHPLSSPGGIAFSLLLTTCIIVLPLLSVSTVVSNFARMTMVLLGGIVGGIGLTALTSLIPNSNVSTPEGLWSPFAVVLIVCVAVVLLQYWTRKVWLARVLLIAVPVAAQVIGACSGDLILQRDYPQASNPGLPVFAVETTLIQGDKARDAGQITIQVPVVITGVQDNQASRLDDLRVSIDTADGIHRLLPWQHYQGSSSVYFPGHQEDTFEFLVDRDLYTHMKLKPATLHFALALTDLQKGDVQTIAMADHDFTVPGFGICAPGESGLIGCRAPLRQPQLTYIETSLADGECPAAPVVQSTAWTGDLSPSPGGFDLGSVQTVNIGLSNQTTSDKDGESKIRNLCPGTPIRFTRYGPVQRMQLEMTVANITVQDAAH